MTLTLRYMTLADVSQVVGIDRQSFSPPWSAQSYAYEIKESNYSHMMVLERHDGDKPLNGLRRLMLNLSGMAQPEHRVLAYGGLWHISNEAHISTIAVDPTQRGRGYGEVALVGMLCRSLTLRAGYVLLEVRVSNFVAQNLYFKYGFFVTAVKPRYYHNDGEDAYEMRLDLGSGETRANIYQRFAELRQHHGFVDSYSSGAPRGQR